MTPQLQLWHGDCLSLMDSIEPESVDLILTDPPYAVLKHKEAIKRHGAKEIERYQVWDDMTIPKYYRMLLEFSKKAYKVGREGTTLYCFCATENAFLLRMALERTNWRWVMVNFFHKTNPAPVVRGKRPQSSVETFGMAIKVKNNTFNAENFGRIHNWIECDDDVFEYPTPNGFTRTHPAQKPLKLMEELIRRSSNEDDLVLDPFAGSGVTLKACRNLNRRGIGIEISQDYYDVAKTDLESYLL